MVAYRNRALAFTAPHGCRGAGAKRGARRGGKDVGSQDIRRVAVACERTLPSARLAE